MLKKQSSLKTEKIRFTVFLVPSVAISLQKMPRKKRHNFVNVSLEKALERERVISLLDRLSKTKTDFARGPNFIRKIRKEWKM